MSEQKSRWWWPFGQKRSGPFTYENAPNHQVPQFIKSLTVGDTLSTSQHGRRIHKDLPTDEAIKFGFKASTYVYACVQRLMKAVASVQWHASVKDSNGDWVADFDHPLTQILQRPNPHMSRQDLFERMTAHLYLGGNFTVTKVRSERRPTGTTGHRGIVVELWPLDPSGVEPIPDRVDFIDRYEYEKGDIRLLGADAIAPEDMIHGMFTDPSTPYWGMSPLQAGAMVVDTETEATKWQRISMVNRAVPDGAWSLDGFLTQDQFDTATEQVRQQHQGANNARVPWVMGSNAKWNQFSLTPVEMDFIESRKLTRQEICALYGVPTPLVQIFDDAPLANVQIARRIFWSDTVVPVLEDLDDTLNRSLTPEFGDPASLRIDYDVSHIDVFMDDFAGLVETAERLWGMGVPFNEVNQRLSLGFDPIAGGDTGLVPANVVPLALITGEDDFGTSNDT